MSNASDKSHPDSNEKSKNADKAAAGGRKRRQKFGAKADFIRSMSPETPAKEVVAAGAKKGLKITESHVYNLRSTTKKRGRAIAARFEKQRSERPKHLKPPPSPERSALRYLDQSAEPLIIEMPEKPPAYAVNEMLAADALNHLIDSRIRQFFMGVANAGRMAR